MVSDRMNLSLRYVLSIELDDHYDQENALNYYYVIEIILMFNPEKGEPSVELYRSQAHNNVYDLTDGDDGAVMLENDEIHVYFTFCIFLLVVIVAILVTTLVNLVNVVTRFVTVIYQSPVEGWRQDTLSS